MANSASDYFLADRRLPPWLFVLGATVTSFTGWTFLGNPAVIFRDGFQFADSRCVPSPYRWRVSYSSNGNGSSVGASVL